MKQERFMAVTVDTGDGMPDVVVTVAVTGAGSVVVAWHEFTEELPTLSAALGFVAALARCGETGWSVCLNNADVFTDAVETFLDTVTG